MKKAVEVKPLERHRVWVRFSDGAEGIADLSRLAGKGVFSVWENEEFFKTVFVDEETNAIAWEGGIDLCPDNLYAEITGRDPASLFREE